jgi:transposase
VYNPEPTETMKKANLKPTDPPPAERRVIGLDAHPDSFTAARLLGLTPASAIVEKTFNQVPLAQLQKWASQHTTAQDLIVLEASGNSFQIVRALAAVERQASVLESAHMGKLKEAHANNDKISAVRIGKAYLAGTAKVVWVPDAQTQERRDLFHAHRKAVKRLTQMRNRLLSYLSDQGVRLKKGTRLTPVAQGQTRLRTAKTWTPRQWQILEGHLLELGQADQQRVHWRSLIAQEVLADPKLLDLVRLCGVREIVAFALGAIIGDITRFSEPRKLVKYIGLNPAFDDSGEGQWHGGIGGHGRKDLRALLIQAAHAILRAKTPPLAKWGWKLFARKGVRNVAVAAVARKLTVAIWYLMMGKWTAVEEIDTVLSRKVGQLITQVGREGLKRLGKTRPALREETFRALKAGQAAEPAPKAEIPSAAEPAPPAPAAKVYGLKPDLKFTPKRRTPKAQSDPHRKVGG